MFVAYYDTGSCHFTGVEEGLKIFLSKQKSTGKSDQKYSFSVKTNLYLFLATFKVTHSTLPEPLFGIDDAKKLHVLNLLCYRQIEESAIFFPASGFISNHLTFL